MTHPSAEDALAKIRAEAELSDDKLRFVRTCRHGDEIRQGDLYLYPLDTAPTAELVRRSSLKLAAGKGPGSRHIVVGEAVAFEPLDRHDSLAGPLLHALERVVLTHPEHADVSLPAGWYEVRYQRDFSVNAFIPRRVMD